MTKLLWPLICTVSFLMVPNSLMQAQQNSQSKPRYAIILHGGAGGEPETWSDAYKAERRACLDKALAVGVKLLETGAPSLDAVEAVVRVLEDDPMFNAGRGCVLNEQGEHELDASIMDGRTLACGAVASIKKAKNPITVARHVMTDTRHVVLIGVGADKFAEESKLELAGPDWFITEEQRAQWKKWKARQEQIDKGVNIPHSKYLGTVGCVAIDKDGNIAAATSTGGLMGKRWGRVGDTPVIGAGTYANNKTCGVSCTGTGEEFIRHTVAGDMSARLHYAGASLEAAATTIIKEVLPDDCGGLIAVDKNYKIVAQFNTPALARAWANSEGVRQVRLEREQPGEASGLAAPALTK